MEESNFSRARKFLPYSRLRARPESPFFKSSALGHKQTLRLVRLVSALLPKADITVTSRNNRTAAIQGEYLNIPCSRSSSRRDLTLSHRNWSRRPSRRLSSHHFFDRQHRRARRQPRWQRRLVLLADGRSCPGLPVVRRSNAASCPTSFLLSKRRALPDVNNGTAFA